MTTDSRSNKAHCLDDLRRRILTQDLEPGLPLDETALADHYAISRPPLREVLRQLAGEGYLLAQPNGAGLAIGFAHDPATRAYLDGLDLLLANAVIVAPARVR